MTTKKGLLAMAIRLQPIEIEIPGKDPFKNALLSRKDPQVAE